MPLIKLATAARRARMGSVTAVRRALVAAGVPLVTLSPGEFAVEEADLSRFLERRHEEPAPAPPPKRRPKPADGLDPPSPPAYKVRSRRRRQ